MELIVDLTEVIASYKKYLETKLGSGLDNMEMFNLEHHGASLKEVPITMIGKTYIRFK
jgi:hypothetical protein